MKKASDYPVEVVFPGGDPKLVIMDNNGDQVEEINLTTMSEKAKLICFLFDLTETEMEKLS